MSSVIEDPAARSRRRGPSRAFAVVATFALFGGVLVGCAAAPRAVLNVPGNYVADLWTPTLEYPTGGPRATVLMCLDEASAVALGTGTGGEGSVGIIQLTWAGVTYAAPSNGSPTTLETPVLQPGCGLLTFGVDCCHVDHYLAISATKV